jgi:hypothetical protein
VDARYRRTSEPLLERFLKELAARRGRNFHLP